MTLGLMPYDYSIAELSRNSSSYMAIVFPPLTMPKCQTENAFNADAEYHAGEPRQGLQRRCCLDRARRLECRWTRYNDLDWVLPLHPLRPTCATVSPRTSIDTLDMTYPNMRTSCQSISQCKAPEPWSTTAPSAAMTLSTPSRRRICIHPHRLMKLLARTATSRSRRLRKNSCGVR